GLARAYARDILRVDEKLIIEIFGNENTEKDKEKLRAGKVVFHDAFPVLDDSYKLNVEINNCHHQEYYNGNGQKEPGDWENPNPTYFLSVKPGAKFNFILSLRQDLKDKLEEETNIEVAIENGSKRRLKNKELVSKTFEILSGALAHLGLGAKTAAGFGTMAEVKDNGHVVPDIPESLKKYKLETTLQFITPAFLAGAFQEKEDCDIFVNTLKGQLRWWWRKIYEKTLDTSRLWQLEKLVWGSTENSSPVRIEVSNIEEGKKKIIPYRTQENRNQEMKYISFGMWKMGDNRDRWMVNSGIEFNISIVCRDSYVKNENTGRYENRLNASKVYEQVLFALYLLTNFGGLGAKSRKGFGSVRCLDVLNLEEGNTKLEINEDLIKTRATELARNFFDDQKITINNLFHHDSIDITINQNENHLQKLAKVYLAFAQSKAHDPHKGYLGLPHKFDRPAQDIKICENLKNYERYASPILFHLEPINNAQGWKLNISIFPKNFLNQNQPNNREIRTNCEEFLSEFIKYIRQNINNNNLVIETYGNRNNRRNNNYRGRHP
ncbi:MAG TPA: type III-B CRISPR module RAMP protein Cmr6, partial [Elusimicrobiales bacterium]|nr:type III-B CRISPR module RAMP protein Cmr6 [Elusimicrobiales bacterium]